MKYAPIGDRSASERMEIVSPGVHVCFLRWGAGRVPLNSMSPPPRLLIATVLKVCTWTMLDIRALKAPL